MARRRFVALQGARPVVAHGFSHPRVPFSELARCIDAALLKCAGGAMLASVVGVGLMAAPGLAVADTFIVTKLVDTDDGACDADCSLREAIAAANAAATADTVDATSVAGTILLGGTEIAITGANDLVITGPGADRLTVDANALSRVFNSTATGLLTIEGMTLAHGETAGSGGAFESSGTPIVLDDVTIRDSNASYGGGFAMFDGNVTIANSSIRDNSAGDANGGFFVNFGTAELTDSVVSGNTSGGYTGGFGAYGDVVLRRTTVSGNRAGLDPGADFGSIGGVISYGTITAWNSTISNNTAATYAGGLWAYLGLTLHHTTVTGNTAVGGTGGGLYADDPVDPIVLHDSIVAGNNGGTGDPDLAGGTVTSAYSLVGVEPADFTDSGGSLTGTLANPLDPGLGPLADNDGPTLTHDLLPDSPARDSGDPEFALPPDFDQRGAPYVRLYNGRLDMGALERQPSDVVFAHGFELLPPQTVTFAADNLPLDISGPGTHEATIPVAGTGTVVKVEITFRFDQPLVDTGQLEAILAAPNGDSIELTPSTVCGSASMLGPYTFKDDPVPNHRWPGYPCPGLGEIITLGQFKPYDPALSFAKTFRGDPADGTWRLRLNVTAGSPGTFLERADLRLSFDSQ